MLILTDVVVCNANHLRLNFWLEMCAISNPAVTRPAYSIRGILGVRPLCLKRLGLPAVRLTPLGTCGLTGRLILRLTPSSSCRRSNAGRLALRGIFGSLNIRGVFIRLTIRSVFNSLFSSCCSLNGIVFSPTVDHSLDHCNQVGM